MDELSICPTQMEQDLLENDGGCREDLYQRGYQEHPYLPAIEFFGAPPPRTPPRARRKQARPKEPFEQGSLKVTFVLSYVEWAHLQRAYNGPTKAKKKILFELRKILGLHAVEIPPEEGE